MTGNRPKIKRRIMTRVLCLLTCSVAIQVNADQTRSNRGHDPFFQISHAVNDCPIPLGPLETEKEWLDDSHYRIERGNSCWIEGRCRLSNAYLYDAEIAEAVQRRLVTINLATYWREKTTLWLTLQRRFIYVEGCIAPGFDKHTFLSELAKTADVDRVIDNTVSDPHAAQLPYKTLSNPDRPVSDPGN